MTTVIIDLNYDRNYKSQDQDRTGTCDMRVSKEQAAENREGILKAASRLMRERGIAGVSVDALTEAAGMTHGSLYSQFGSKERLVEEAVAYAITTKEQDVPEAFAVRDFISQYLSAAHRDAPGNGCALAALACEMSRQSQTVREPFTAGLQRMISRLSNGFPSDKKQRKRREDALVTIASLVGAVVLARAVNDPKLSDDILRATRTKLSG